MRRTRISTVATITAVAALLAPAAPALAEAPKGPISAEAVALMTTQERLHRIADRVEQTNGFSGFYVDAGSRTLNVYWKGTVPAKLRAEAVAAKAMGLEVRIHPAKYSRAELSTEAARLGKATSSITSITVKYDGSGLAVKQNAGMSAKSGVQSPVPVEVEAGTAELAVSRSADYPLYKGGGLIKNIEQHQPKGSCSSGFAVVSTITGHEELLTAAHCGRRGSWYLNGAGDSMGDINYHSIPSDSATIFTAGQPRVWIGDSIQNEANQYGLDVVGASSTLPGDWLCTSGAFSGTICEIRASQTGLRINFDGFGEVRNLVEAVHTGSYSAGGNGDSGGPVFSVQQPGDQLIARGTLTAISTDPADVRQCSGVPAGNGRTCSQRIYFPDITVQLRDHGLRIKTI